MKLKLTPVIPNPDNMTLPLWDNSNRIAKILYRIRPYGIISWHVLKKGVPFMEIARTQFPYVLPNANRPSAIAVEFTNHCNINCVYCNNPKIVRPRGFMSIKTFSRLIKNIIEMNISRVIVGGGEPTLHPKFASFTSELAKSVKFLSIVTGGQWTRKEIAYEMLEAPFDLIEISVDAGGKQNYEKSRKGACYKKLFNNLKLLKKAKKELRASSIINIRLMLRPSQKTIEKHQIKYWSQFSDIIMPQYIVKVDYVDYHEDIYLPVQHKTQAYPKCSIPFKEITVQWNGEIPLCGPSGNQIDLSHRLIIDNINESSISDIWDGKVFQQYRKGHRNRELDKIQVCRGCMGH
ncbi:MAG: radical SAM protein [Candidatus Stahlbacteria bacterium]|nr:MAG: radical SAM protein [Candidatus Stahlbacteria bacterium]